jgi:hypothetical protein
VLQETEGKEMSGWLERRREEEETREDMRGKKSN